LTHFDKVTGIVYAKRSNRTDRISLWLSSNDREMCRQSESEWLELLQKVNSENFAIGTTSFTNHKGSGHRAERDSRDNRGDNRDNRGDNRDSRGDNRDNRGDNRDNRDNRDSRDSRRGGRYSSGSGSSRGGGSSGSFGRSTGGSTEGANRTSSNDWNRQ
jgi:hypothetical protein